MKSPSSTPRSHLPSQVFSAFGMQTLSNAPIVSISMRLQYIVISFGVWPSLLSTRIVLTSKLFIAKNVLTLPSFL